MSLSLEQFDLSFCLFQLKESISGHQDVKCPLKIKEHYGSGLVLTPLPQFLNPAQRSLFVGLPVAGPNCLTTLHK